MNHKQYITIFLALYFILYTSYSPVAFAQTPNDVTSQIENLGNPTKARWPDTNSACRYARNPWDLQNFNNKIYIGSGNSSNTNPCPNAGPVPINSYNPATNQFTTEFTGDGEQVETFRIIDNKLIAPNHDPKNVTDKLAWFELSNGSWSEKAPAIGLVHNFDFYKFGGILFAGGAGTNPVMGSIDGGVTWQNYTTPVLINAYSLFELNGKFYASTVWIPISNNGGLNEYTSGTSFTNFVNLKAAQMFPNTTLSANSTRIYRPVNFALSLVYIGADVINDIQVLPFGLYKATGFTASAASVTRLNLPNNALPWDIITANGKVYILGSIQNGSRYWVTVSSSSDLNTFTEEFRFDASTFARSFENLNNDWYFGLGTDTATLSTATGDILRYSTAASSPSPNPSPSPSPTKQGDIDLDGDVDIFDYNQLLTDFNKQQPGLASDIDNSGKVDIFDYNLLLTNFGK